MKKTCINFLILFLLISGLHAQKLADEVHNQQLNFYEIQEVADDYFKEKYAPSGNPTFKRKSYNGPVGIEEFQKIDGEYSKYKRWEWYWSDRLLPDSSFPDLLSLYEQRDSPRLRIASNQFSVLKWKNINQKNATGGYNGMGRTSAIAFHPTNPSVFYVGAPIGGIWKTTDGGNSYEPLGDKLPYVSVGNIVVDHQNPDVIYISIGDHLGWWNYSLGVYKSTDGGNTWSNTGFQKEFQDGFAIYKMEMSPDNNQVLLIATSKGLFRSADGGATWQKIRDGEHRDVKFRPGDGNTVYAAYCDWWSTSEVYKSTDAGLTFTQKTNLNSAENSIILAVTPANPNVVAFLTRKEKAFYLSEDGGETFTHKSTVPETDVIYASPSDASVFYCGFVNVYQSGDKGSTWNQKTIWYGSNDFPEVHADQRYVKHNPLNNRIYFCNDGGIYEYNETTDSWMEFSDGLIITQFYRIAVAQTDPVVMIGGTQDNGGRKRRPDGTWTATNGGDAMEVAIDPTNENILYTTYVNGELYRSTDGWTNDTYHNIRNNIPGQPEGSWVTPYVLDPNEPSTIVAGYQDVFRSQDRGDNWEQLSYNLTGSTSTKLQAIAVAKGSSSTIYASAGTTFYFTTNSGQNWGSYNFNGYDRITSIAVHPENAQTVFVTFAGYREGKKVSVSYDGGLSWADFSGSLPNVPANGLVIDEAGNDALYAGTDFGVFYRDATMTDWQKYGADLPNTNVNDLEIQKKTGMLRIGTFGRGVYEIPLWSQATALKEPDPVPDNLVKGARYWYYQGAWSELPDFSALKNISVTKGGVVSSVTLTDVPAREENYAVRYSTFMNAPDEGIYTFYLSSDDGSKLYVGDDVVISNDGEHGNKEVSGTIGLKQGYHKIEVEYFQGLYGKDLNLDWEGPGFERRNTIDDIWVEDTLHSVPSEFPATKYGFMYGMHASNNGELMGWIDAGDSLVYTIKTDDPGFYKLVLDYASPFDDRQIEVRLNGELEASYSLKNSGGWGDVSQAETGVYSLSGTSTLSLKNTNGSFDYYKLKLIKTDCKGVENGGAFVDDCGVCIDESGEGACTITGFSKSGNNASSILVSPNPFSEELFVKAGSEVMVTFYSVLGEKVWDTNLSAGGRIAPPVMPGIYYVSLIYKDGRAEKFLVEKLE